MVLAFARASRSPTSGLAYGDEGSERSEQPYFPTIGVRLIRRQQVPTPRLDEEAVTPSLTKPN